MARKKAPKIYPYKQHRLMWPPSLYKEWYLHAKLADKNIGTFEDWFDPKLYAEPMQDDDVKVVSKKNNKLVLEFDLTHDLRRIGINFLKVITKYKSEYTYHSLAKIQPSKSAKNFTLETSKERRQVYLLKQKGVKNLEIAKKLNLITKEVYEWKKLSAGTKKHTTDRDIRNKLSKLEAVIAKKLNNTSDLEYLNAERTIQRHNAACKKIIKNVKQGIFP